VVRDTKHFIPELNVPKLDCTIICKE
jgi:hypothetical protein